jgi:hypothetical protein
MNLAFAQNETILGQKCIKEATNLTPSLLSGNPPALVTLLALTSLMNETEPSDSNVKRIFTQLPRELDWLVQYMDWAIAYRDLIQGLHKIIYDPPGQGKQEILKAKKLGISLSQTEIRKLTQMVLDNRIALGSERVDFLLQKISKDLEAIGERNTVSRIKAEIAINLAFIHHKSGNYRIVPGEILKTIWYQPSYIANRGMASIFVNSLSNILRQSFGRVIQ